MSAPWEITIKDVSWGYEVTRPAPVLDGFTGVETRYLRADLTCGECGHRNEIPAAKKWACTQRGMYVGRTEVACMAFVPKGE